MSILPELKAEEADIEDAMREIKGLEERTMIWDTEIEEAKKMVRRTR